MLLDYKWGSNIPPIQTVMEFFNPTGILELGMGKYSTRLLYSYNKKLISIETDGDWVDTIKKTIVPRDNFQVIHHQLGVHHKTKFNQISDQVKLESIEFYKQYITPDLEFLFVDHVSGLRASSILGLLDQFKYIVYHDAQPSQFKNYNYQILTKEKTKNYVHFIWPLPIVSSGILIHKNYEDKVQGFVEMLNKNSRSYCDRFDMIYNEVGNV